MPPGFTVSTQVCNIYLAGGNRVPDEIETEMAAKLAHLEADLGKKLGDAAKSATAVGPFRVEVLDARNDGHDPQPRPE